MNIAKLKPFLLFNDLEIVTDALISSRMDYRNPLYFGISQSSMPRLQACADATARLLTGTRKRDSITPHTESVLLTRLQGLQVK